MQLFCFKNRPQSVLKDMGYGCIYFDLSLHLLSFWNGVYNDFQNQGLIFKNCKFSNWDKNLSSPKIQKKKKKMNSWFDAFNDQM